MTSHCSRSRSTDPPAPTGGIVSNAATMYQLMVENTLDVIIQYGPDRERIYVSPASREMLGYEPAEMMVVPVTTIIHPDDYPFIHPKFLAFGPAQPSLQLTYRARRKDGSFIWVEGHYRYVPSDGTSIAVLRDINDRKTAEILLQEANDKLEEANAILRRLAQQDGLTGLANRRRFDEMMGHEIRRSARQQEFLAILLIDVDCFKAYNDLYGHLAGDECLRDISRCLEAAIRRPGDCAARFGGEEFVMLLPATDLAGAMLLADKLRQGVLGLAIEHRGSPHRLVSISVGASAMIPYAEDDPSLLLDAADRALYRAKAGGRNMIHASDADICATVM